MTSFCTYCSAKKNNAKHLLSAIERYDSIRIKNIHRAAMNLDIGFFILSGKYGLLDRHEEIEYYDHLLVSSEVNDHAQLVARQLKEQNIKDLIFFTNPLTEDENLAAYINCIQQASQINGNKLKVVIINLPE